MGSYTNKEMASMIEPLYGLLDHRDIVGYAAARNLRRLQEASREYLDIRDGLLVEYGAREFDESGSPTGRFSLDPMSENGAKYLEEIAKFDNIRHEVEIYMVPIEDTIGMLSGREMLALDWMLSSDDAA